MQKFFISSVIMLVASFGQLLGQSTSTTTRSQNREGRRETYTSTETRIANGRTITTTTTTSTTNAIVSFGLKSNANMSNFFIKELDGIQSNMGVGFSTGAFMKIESDYFAIQYELLLHYKTSELENQAKADYKQWALELPMYLMGQIFTGSGKIFIGAGPYVGFGLDAKQSPGKIDLYQKDQNAEKAIMHRWDFGLGAMVGYEFKNGISFSAAYQAGLINRLSAEKDVMSMKNQTLSAGLGYKFF